MWAWRNRIESTRGFLHAAPRLPAGSAKEELTQIREIIVPMLIVGCPLSCVRVHGVGSRLAACPARGRAVGLSFPQPPLAPQSLDDVLLKSPLSAAHPPGPCPSALPRTALPKGCRPRRAAGGPHGRLAALSARWGRSCHAVCWPGPPALSAALGPAGRRRPDSFPGPRSRRPAAPGRGGFCEAAARAAPRLPSGGPRVHAGVPWAGAPLGASPLFHRLPLSGAAGENS